MEDIRPGIKSELPQRRQIFNPLSTVETPRSFASNQGLNFMTKKRVKLSADTCDPVIFPVIFMKHHAIAEDATEQHSGFLKTQLEYQFGGNTLQIQSVLLLENCICYMLSVWWRFF